MDVRTYDGCLCCGNEGSCPIGGDSSHFQNDRMSVVPWMWARTYELFHAIGKLSFYLITIILMS